MMPAATTAGGTFFGAPDVCLTPSPPLGQPTPVPYPNTAQAALATPPVMTVLIQNRPAIAQGSRVPISSGDEPGVNGGQISGTFIGPVEPMTFSSKVHFGGRKAVYLTSISGHNGVSANQPLGAMIMASQDKVFVAV